MSRTFSIAIPSFGALDKDPAQVATPQPAFLFEQVGGDTAEASRRAAGETLVPFPPSDLTLDGL